MSYTGNENIPLHFDCCTKEATKCLNRRQDLEDYIELYHNNDSLLADEKFVFYVSSV
jgi:hypothetical protein